MDARDQFDGSVGDMNRVLQQLGEGNAEIEGEWGRPRGRVEITGSDAIRLVRHNVFDRCAAQRVVTFALTLIGWIFFWADPYLLEVGCVSLNSTNCTRASFSDSFRIHVQFAFW